MSASDVLEFLRSRERAAYEALQAAKAAQKASVEAVAVAHALWSRAHRALNDEANRRTVGTAK